MANANNDEKRQQLVRALKALSGELREEGRREDSQIVWQASQHITWQAGAADRIAARLELEAGQIDAGTLDSYSVTGVASAALRLAASRLRSRGDVPNSA